MKPGEGLHMFTIYENPRDYPGRFVVRESVVNADSSIVVSDNPVAIVHSLEDARAAVPPGLVMLTCSPEDDPVVVEVWF